MLVFVYGTLTEEARVDALLEDWSFRGAATLEGLHRVEGDYPTLAPGGRVEGRLLRTDEVDRLDAFEGVDRGLYLRVGVPLGGSGGEDSVAVYLGDPDHLDAPASWPGDGSFEARVRRYLDDSTVTVRVLDDR